jgi:hypothetical protein
MLKLLFRILRNVLRHIRKSLSVVRRRLGSYDVLDAAFPRPMILLVTMKKISFRLVLLHQISIFSHAVRITPHARLIPERLDVR